MEGFNFLRGISLIPILIGTVAVLYPKKTVRVFLFPILYLGFAVPMPPFLLAEITNPLLEANTWMVEKAMSLVGIEFLLSGNTFLVTDLNTRSVHAIQLVDGCSGIHSIFALFAVVCLYLYWSGASLLRSSAMLAAALPLAAIGNVSRVLATIQITRSFGPGPGQTFFHEYSGFLVFTLTLLCLFALERKR
jgi:exosortase